MFDSGRPKSRKFKINDTIMKRGDFLELTKGKVNKTCEVSVCSPMNPYTGEFSGIIFNEEHDLCMCLTMDVMTSKRFRNIAQVDGLPVMNTISIRVSAIETLEFKDEINKL